MRTSRGARVRSDSAFRGYHLSLFQRQIPVKSLSHFRLLLQTFKVQHPRNHFTPFLPFLNKSRRVVTLKIHRLPQSRRLSPRLKTTRNETREIAPCTIRPSSCSRQCLTRQVHAFSSLTCPSPTYCDLSLSCHLHQSHTPSRPSFSHRHHKSKPLSRVCAPSPFRLTSSFPTRSSLPLGLSSSPRHGRSVSRARTAASKFCIDPASSFFQSAVVPHLASFSLRRYLFIL